MGTHIHAYLEEKVNGVWKDRNFYRVSLGASEDGKDDKYFIKMLDIGRCSDLFAVLAGVRNHIGVKPIAAPKGLPTDCSRKISQIAGKITGDVYHDASWYTVSELAKATKDYSSVRYGYGGFPETDGKGVLDDLLDIIGAQLYRLEAICCEDEMYEKGDNFRIVFWFET